ncbi:heavy-metal-associated domain-containing protein [Aromatoleum aromaticum]|uniref:Predicted copper chaperone n=1 Tax=Aromatoleum aromaticum (strain DSM 19018 / LMG 30748 / EbN1) TaxID=76114 RepID=Q5P0V8_AROAE|nr:cation transporter [Aromatoleum aromaticum]NMG55822.1 heavy metal transporter [Aromatoleum aromaticum]CAI09056.1 predicted copper chaperone [Aromatoleum aromaticum EbN1]
MVETVIRVEGMSCGGCVNSVTAALKSLPGVTDANVSLDSAQARVQYDPATVSEQQLREAVEEAGFDAPA